VFNFLQEVHPLLPVRLPWLSHRLSLSRLSLSLSRRILVLPELEEAAMEEEDQDSEA